MNHTEGPWRWEFNWKSKDVHLVGGRPQFDLTVMDFTRWGMGSATPRFRDVSVNGMNIMHRLCDQKDWIEAFPGRSHHLDWCAAVNHPDARLMAAAPVLKAALEAVVNAHKGNLTSLAMRVDLAEKILKELDGYDS